MELVEITPRNVRHSTLRACEPGSDPKTALKPKCYRRYVQPARARPFLRQSTYRPPSKPLAAETTYHSSYRDVEARCARSEPFRPVATLRNPSERFAEDTTSRLTYKPVWTIVRAQPILPKRRAFGPTVTGGPGTIECESTTRREFTAKCVEKPRPVVPGGHIRTSTAAVFEDKTIAKLSYADPGPVPVPDSFKPVAAYTGPSGEPLSCDTTHKLSYQPTEMPARSIDDARPPWARKPTYEPPACAMSGKTIYAESYVPMESSRVETPFVPVPSPDIVFPRGDGFRGQTVYKGSYAGHERVEPVAPFRPSPVIRIPEERMSCDTTNKLSYQGPLGGARRAPIRPSAGARRPFHGDGPMACETTTGRDYHWNEACRSSKPSVVLPRDNIQIVDDAPIDDRTTVSLSYKNPGKESLDRPSSFKPSHQYRPPSVKMNTETINRLSFQQWTPLPKEELPWARKRGYEPPPVDCPMPSDTLYKTSYPPPGRYVEVDCTEDDDDDDSATTGARPDMERS